MQIVTDLKIEISALNVVKDSVHRIIFSASSNSLNKKETSHGEMYFFTDYKK